MTDKLDEKITDIVENLADAVESTWGPGDFAMSVHVGGRLLRLELKLTTQGVTKRLDKFVDRKAVGSSDPLAVAAMAAIEELERERSGLTLNGDDE